MKWLLGLVIGVILICSPIAINANEIALNAKLQRSEIKNMSYEPTQLRNLIEATLIWMEMDSGKGGLYSEDAVELLMMTAATESHLGTYLVQINGPAKGMFQMEPATEQDIWDNYLKFKNELLQTVVKTVSAIDMAQGTGMATNLIHQIVMARVFYLRIPEALPSKDDLGAMAKYYKKYWNTKLGKAIVANVVYDYKRLAKPENA